jgi:hypothetical protein
MLSEAKHLASYGPCLGYQMLRFTQHDISITHDVLTEEGLYSCKMIQRA